jgi:L-rhamnose mutarotase
MQRVAEVIHIVPEERDAYLQLCLNLDEEANRLLWLHGIRNQYYFLLNDLILMTFEYVGNSFYKDMAEIAAFPGSHKYMVPTRRKDVPADQLETTNWWAPLKRMGGILTSNPFLEDEEQELNFQEQYRSMISGDMIDEALKNDISFSEDDWSESVHF